MFIMKILVNQIPFDGTTINGTLDPVKLGLGSEHIKFLSLVNVACFVSRTKDDLLANCKLITSVKHICSRCLCEFEAQIKKEISLYYELNGELSIVFDDDLKDEIIMDLPVKILCKQDCKGLCAQCGKNLNEGFCGCKIIKE